MVMEVATIGKCSGCEKMSSLKDLACKSCNARYGDGCGLIMARIRNKPMLARMFYDRLTNEPARERFITMFGTPWIRDAT